MKFFQLIVFPFLLTTITACSDQKSETEADNKDHVLRQQIDVMRDAQSVQQQLNRATEEQNRQADAIAGH